MKFILCERQSVVVQYENIYFCHVTQRGHVRSFMLTDYQFENLNDLIKETMCNCIRNYPLGAGLWLSVTASGYQLTNHRDNTYFIFIDWERYKRHVHPRVMSFLRHDVDMRGEDYQYDADDESRQLHRPRSPPRKKRRTLASRSTRDARSSTEQSQKRAILSRWDRSNPRKRPQRRGRVDEARSVASPSRESKCDTSSDEEHCSECSIDETTLPTLME